MNKSQDMEVRKENVKISSYREVKIFLLLVFGSQVFFMTGFFSVAALAVL